MGRTPISDRAAKPDSQGSPFMHRQLLAAARLHLSSQDAAAALALGCVIAAASLPATAQERRTPASVPEMQLSFAPVVKRAAPAVVNVYAARTVANQNPLFDDPIFRRFFGGPGGPGGPGGQGNRV